METRIKSLLNAPASVIITDNTRSIISVTRKGRYNAVRLHHMFLNADMTVLRALADYINGKSRGVGKTLRIFIKKNEGKIRKRTGLPAQRKISIITRGSYFDLAEPFKRLNNDYFNRTLTCSITWGFRRKRARQKSVRLGSYSRNSSLIRINPVLDRPFVPLFVVEDIIYHEMLHHALGFKKRNGRCISHGREFKEMEKRYIRREEARLWIGKNLPRLLK